MNDLKKYIPKLIGNKSVLVSMIVSLLCLCAIVVGTSKLVFAYQHATDVKAQITTMNDFIADWTSKSEIVNKAPMRPVDISQVDAVQTDIFFALQTAQLNLTKFSIAPNSGSQEDRHKSFEVEFTGSYESTMKFLDTFHAKDALIKITSLKMTTVKNNIQTNLVYKVYVK